MMEGIKCSKLYMATYPEMIKKEINNIKAPVVFRLIWEEIWYHSFQIF
jgi:molybdopterin synthase catalytic subunit